MIPAPMSAETLLELYALLAAISDPVRKLSSVFTRIQSGFAAADRVFAFMDREPAIRANSDDPILLPHHRDIEFRNVCFSYKPTDPILTGVSLTVRHGETVALVGKNGCGKTTLLNLLARFYDPDHGTILVDGRDIRGVNLRSLRRQIGIVTQETFLFDTTILKNIAYGRPRASREQVEAAARQAHAHDIILALPQGYDTRVGEAGHALSGGQRQRIALARAFLLDPSILILDEFTNQTDTEAEMEVHRILQEYRQGAPCSSSRTGSTRWRSPTASSCSTRGVSSRRAAMRICCGPVRCTRGSTRRRRGDWWRDPANPKSEYRNPKQIQNPKYQCPKPTWRRLAVLNFGFWICLGFRYSDFGFQIRACSY